MKIEIDNYWELLALHKSLMAVKFDENSCLREAQGSPYTGSLAFKIFEQLVGASNEKQATDWRKWQGGRRVTQRNSVVNQAYKGIRLVGNVRNESKRKLRSGFHGSTYT